MLALPTVVPSRATCKLILLVAGITSAISCLSLAPNTTRDIRLKLMPGWITVEKEAG